MDIVKFIIAAFATYRLAQLIVYDNGPFFIFKRIRIFIENKSKIEDDERVASQIYEYNKYGFWLGAKEGITCPFCMGIWMAFLCAILLLFPSVLGDLFLVAFGLAGVQSVIERFTV